MNRTTAIFLLLIGAGILAYASQKILRENKDRPYTGIALCLMLWVWFWGAALG